jgi:protein-disulfide isomerase
VYLLVNVIELRAMPEETITPVPRKQNLNLNLNQYLIPASILVGFALVAGAIFVSGGTNTLLANKGDGKAAQQIPQNVEKKDTTSAVRKVTAEDHIKGSSDALVKIVEYSDYECPFCKRFHDTMNAVIEKYGDSKDVAWVYRHFPLEQLHPKNAMKVAIASECAVEQGDKDMFWKFTDRWFELTLTNDRTDLAVVLPQIYSEIGLDKAKMDECVVSGRYDEHIQSDFDNAVATGGQGTPWSVVIAPNGVTFPLNGAQQIETIEQVIELAKKEE